VPPLISVVPDYYVYDGTWYAVASEDIMVNVDINNNDSVDNTVSISKLTRGSINIPSDKIARIYSDRPFYLYNVDSIVGPAGTDFNIAWSKIEKIVVTEDNTTVKADTNNNGIYDWFQSYNKGITSSLDFGEGSRIHSDKPIVVFSSYTCSSDNRKGTSYAPPSNTLGSDLWSKTSDQQEDITGMYDNTTCYLDNVTENDLNPDYTFTINSNETKSPPISSKTHIWADKPLMETYLYYHHPHPQIHNCYIYNPYPYSSISATQHSSQVYLGANELTTMQIRVFNPFANTSIYNVSSTVSFPENFSMPSNTTTIKKLFLRNDILIEETSITVNPSKIGANYVFTVSNSTILNSLEPMQYYQIEYSLVTPSAIGDYKFEPLQLSYLAETWNLPSAS